MPALNSSDRQNYIFYQDEGGYRATDDANGVMDIIYYMGIIDILTPYSNLKKMEHLWKGLKADKVSIASAYCLPSYVASEDIGPIIFASTKSARCHRRSTPIGSSAF
jgi:hypothetical protein